MICHAGITLLTDEAGTPVRVNIDLVRHGAELAAFLRAHGLVAGGSGPELPSGTSGPELPSGASGTELPSGTSGAELSSEGSGTVCDDGRDRPCTPCAELPCTSCADRPGMAGRECLGTVCDELSGAVGGEQLTCRYVPSADRRHIPVVYRPQVRPLLRAAVDKALLSLHGRRKGTSPPAAEEYAATLLTAAERHLHGARLRHKPAPEGYERYGRDMFSLRFRLRCSPDTLWIVCYTLHHGTVIVRYIGTEAKADKK